MKNQDIHVLKLYFQFQLNNINDKINEIGIDTKGLNLMYFKNKNSPIPAVTAIKDSEFIKMSCELMRKVSDLADLKLTCINLLLHPALQPTNKSLSKYLKEYTFEDLTPFVYKNSLTKLRKQLEDLEQYEECEAVTQMIRQMNSPKFRAA